jgi:hypothetical protein
MFSNPFLYDGNMNRQVLSVLIAPFAVFFPQNPVQDLAGAGSGHLGIADKVNGLGLFKLSGDTILIS